VGMPVPRTGRLIVASLFIFAERYVIMIKNYKVVIVDNSKCVTGFIEMLLQDMGFENIHIFFDAEDAINEIIKAPPDLVIVDYDLSVINGLALLALVRRVYPEVKAIMTISYAGELRAVTNDFYIVEKGVNFSKYLYECIRKIFTNDI
jgi:two-component SAPR family response regulator